MNNDHINNNEPDAFSEKLKSKLENHQLAPEVDLWNSIQQAVEAKKRRRIPVWLWVPMSSAAVIALILLLPLLTQSPHLISHSSIVRTTNTKEIQVKKTLPVKAFASVVIPVSTRKFRTNKSTSLITSVSKAPVSLTNSTLSEVTVTDTTVLGNSDIASVTPNGHIIPDIRVVKPDTSSQKMNIASLTEKSAYKSEFRKIAKPKYKNQWILAAAFGSGSSASSGFDNVPAAILSDNIAKTATPNYSIMSPQSFTDVHYSLPLSFGLKVRNKFSKALSIETGLIYTYLQTDFSNSGFYSTDARLSLHYIGIPVSLNVKIWNNPKWEVYISGGGTVEKGLRSIYQQSQNSTNMSWVTTAQTNIDGFQLSVNSAVGVGYKILPKFGIFFEPQFSYYFDNNQPISIRSHQPAVVSMQLGLRYNLNSVQK